MLHVLALKKGLNTDGSLFCGCLAILKLSDMPHVTLYVLLYPEICVHFGSLGKTIFLITSNVFQSFAHAIVKSTYFYFVSS